LTPRIAKERVPRKKYRKEKTASQKRNKKKRQQGQTNKEGLLNRKGGLKNIKKRTGTAWIKKVYTKFQDRNHAFIERKTAGGKRYPKV